MSLTRFAVRRPIATLMGVLAVCIGGLISMVTLPVDLMPNSESSVITIFVGVRGGMPPEDIESLVTEPIEEAVSTMVGLKTVLSVSRKDRSTVTLEFGDTKDVKRASLEVSERLARIKGKLPKEIEKPIVARYNENDHPIVILSATSTVKQPEVIRTLVERDLKPLLSRVPGVANVEISGGRQRKVLVEFDKSKLEMHRIPILDVIRQLGVNNLSLTSGKFDRGRSERAVQFVGDFRSLEEMEQMGVSVTKEGSRIRLKDIAIVKDYYLEPESYARVNNQPTVSIYVQKETGANTIRAAREVLRIVREYEATLPSDMGIGVSIDQSVAINQAIADVRGALTWGALLTALVLLLFLRRLKQVGVIVASIPVAVLATFFAMMIQAGFMEKFGDSPPITINVMSLLGIALGIGRMVDDSIVVFVNIMQRRRDALRAGTPVDYKELAVAATREMAVAVASSTLIMIVIFLPIVLISADIRRLFSDVAFTVVAALLASLAMATTVVPLLASRLAAGGEAEERFAFEARAARRLERTAWRWRPLGQEPAWYVHLSFMLAAFSAMVYFGLRTFGGVTSWAVIALFFLPFLPILVSVLDGRFNALLRTVTAWAVRRRLWVLLGVFVSIGLSVYLYRERLEKEFMGDTEKKEFVIFVELPSGTKLEISDTVVKEVENTINALPEIKEVVKTVAARVEGWSSKLYVTLIPASERTRTVQDVIDALRPKFKPLGAQYEAFIYFSEPRSSRELIIDVFGKDYLELRNLAVEIAKRLQPIPGLRDVKLRYKPGRPELRLEVDHARSAVFGLTSKEIADTLHAQVRGLRATYFNAGNEQVETVARLSEEDRRTEENLRNLSIVAQNGRKKMLVPIQQLLDVEYGNTPSEVWRKDKERVIQVSANRERLALSTAVDRVWAALKGLSVPIGYHYEMGGDYEKLVKSEKEFAIAFVIMLGLVYMVLACFFESYTQPALMLLTIPLATAGSIPALWLTKTPVNMGVYIGLLMLGGTVVSNAVILIDRLNTVRRTRGLLPSVLKVGKERAEPIFMTSLTTIAAMFPLVFSRGESSDLWSPLALTVVCGMVFSSVLTIFVVPAAYVIWEDVRWAVGEWRDGKSSLLSAIRKRFQGIG